MIAPVSFGSIYRINTNNSSNSDQKFFCHKVSDYCEERKIPYTEVSKYDINYPVRNQKFSMITTVFAPNKKDAEFETYLAAHGIKFTKHSQDEILKPKAVMSRVERAPEGFKTVVIDSKKLEDLLLCQEDSNFDSTKSAYKHENRKEALSILKSLNKFPASTVSLRTLFNPEETKRQIKTSGRLENDSMEFSFEQTTDQPDNLMYFAMKEAGLKNIPVYMNEESYKTAQILGIVKE